MGKLAGSFVHNTAQPVVLRISEGGNGLLPGLAVSCGTAVVFAVVMLVISKGGFNIISKKARYIQDA